MFKYLSTNLLLISLCGGSIIGVPSNVGSFDRTSIKSDFWQTWGPDIVDFLELIDIEKVIVIFIEHVSDPEVLDFIGFITSPQFKDVIWEFESMVEFKEAFVFLSSKGYDVESVIDFINSNLELPPFEKPKGLVKSSRGISDFIEALIAALPVDDMKNLFESKLENNSQIKELFDTINSEEFMDILKRMSQNPKFKEIKDIFEVYGFDFIYICGLFQDIFGDYYQGIFCD